MTTARETILAGPQGKVTRGNQTFVRTLFNNFCRYARSTFAYDATKTIQDCGTLLDSRSGCHFRLDCRSVAGAFCLMVQQDLGVLPVSAKVVTVSNPGLGFATKEHSKCFDLTVVGNIRTVSQGFAAVGRCVFGEHYFVEVNGSYYDPCMTTTYTSKGEVMNWKFVGTAFKRGQINPYDDILFKITEEPSKLLIACPQGTPAPNGFTAAFLLVDVHDIDKDIYSRAFGEPKPGWQMKTKSINQFLQAAGLPTYPNLN